MGLFTKSNGGKKAQETTDVTNLKFEKDLCEKFNIGIKRTKSTEDLINDLRTNGYQNAPECPLSPPEPVAKVEETDTVRDIKLLLVGYDQCGSSSLAVRFTTGLFGDELTSSKSIGIYRKRVKLDSCEVVASIIDIHRLNIFDVATDLYIRNADGFIFMYDMAYPETLSDLARCRNYIFVKRGKDFDLPMLMIGHKCDLKDENKDLQLTETDRFSFRYMEASAMLNINVEECFHAILNKCVKKFQKPKPVKTAKKPNKFLEILKKIWQVLTTEPENQITWYLPPHRF